MTNESPPRRMADDGESPEALRQDLAALKNAPVPELDYARGLDALMGRIDRNDDAAETQSRTGSKAVAPGGGASSFPIALALGAVVGAGALGVFISRSLPSSSATPRPSASPDAFVLDTPSNRGSFERGSSDSAVRSEPMHEREDGARASSDDTFSRAIEGVERSLAIHDIGGDDARGDEEGAAVARRTEAPPSDIARSPSGARTGDSDARFRRELVLVERARRSLDSDPAQALRALDAADREVGRGHFDAERQAMRALAWFALGHETRARALATRLLARDPEGLFAARLREALSAPVR